MSDLRVIALSASGSEISKTAALTDHIAGKLRGSGLDVDHLTLRALPLEAMLRYPVTEKSVLELNEMLQLADGIIIATPIYKASFSGLLKLFLDQLPQFALAGKTVLPLATGGSIAHVLALDFALRPVLQSMGVRHAVQAHFVPEAAIDLKDGFRLSPDAAAPLNEAIGHFTHSMQSADRRQLFGHPRPERTHECATTRPGTLSA